jgi:RND family efflux transporter MFP subunit
MTQVNTTKQGLRDGRWTRATAAAVLLAVGGIATVPVAAQDAPLPGIEPSQMTGTERGVTKPVSEPKLAFPKPGVVMKVDVKEGDTVKAGQVLAVQNDLEERAELAALAGDIVGAELQIRASEADMKLKQVQLARKEAVYADLVRAKQSNSELDEARAQVEIAKVAIDYRKQELESAKTKHQGAMVRVKQRELPSPINGVVAKVDVKVGEGSDISRPAIQVVQNDTLYVDANVPAMKAKALKVGDAVQVRYLDEEKWMPAKVIFLTPYANPSSGTRLVRLEMKNDGSREAGLNVHVRLPGGDGPNNAAPAAAASR